MVEKIERISVFTNPRDILQAKMTVKGANNAV